MTESSDVWLKMILESINEQIESTREQTEAINRLAAINAQMVEALMDEDPGDDTPPACYLDGTTLHTGGYQPSTSPMHSLPEKPPPREL